MESTRIAIILSTYNWPEALTLSLRSIFRQTRLPDEIIIADDGSTDATRHVIDTLRKESPRPIKHVWHEDLGFRKTIILNEAIAAADSDYIIQIDGDCVLERHFVEDHMSVAAPGCFICGGRIRLGKEESAALEASGQPPTSVSMANPNFHKSLRIGPLRRLVARRFDRRGRLIHGCNMSFWREDLVRVNGYNEAFIGWGEEDIELTDRLANAGLYRLSLRFGGVCYHLWHTVNAKERELINIDLWEKTREQRLTRCEKGMDGHVGR